MGKALSPEKRRAAILAEATKGYLAGLSLPAIRTAVAAKVGGTAASYLGTVDPIVFRLVGLDSPLTDGKGKPIAATASASVLRSAVRRRRDSGVRWETVAASTEASIGRRVSVAETKALYAKGGGDLDSSYVGRGTRVSAPATYAAPEVAAEVVGTATK